MRLELEGFRVLILTSPNWYIKKLREEIFLKFKVVELFCKNRKLSSMDQVTKEIQ